MVKEILLSEAEKQLFEGLNSKGNELLNRLGEIRFQYLTQEAMIATTLAQNGQVMQKEVTKILLKNGLDEQHLRGTQITDDGKVIVTTPDISPEAK